MKFIRKLHPGEIVTSWLLLAFSLFVLYQAYRISGFSGLSSAGAFPIGAATLMCLSMLYLVIDNLRIARKTEGHGMGFFEVLAELVPLRIILFTALIVIYMLILQPLGFLISTLLFLIAGFIFLGGAGPVKSIIIALVSVGAIYGVFHYLFQVILP
ncbi:tripartite tricarboxylate transporter TctB family protein [Marinobacterium litorale]|uniref:tripartite tricarboxylate transporter TctB family protein n=1 Tax=Marinobacterium litorale TaxID=404770 RepID=UPI0004161BA9|nr:tripartite tricarboxylate transporter TctB family protein [Marinobacterium litorale]